MGHQIDSFQSLIHWSHSSHWFSGRKKKSQTINPRGEDKEILQVRQRLMISGPHFSYNIQHHKVESAVHLLVLSRPSEKQI